MASWLQIGWYTGKVFSQCISYSWGTGNVLSIYVMYCTSRISDLTYHMTIQILCPKCDLLNVKFNVWVPFSVKARPARIFACLKDTVFKSMKEDIHCLLSKYQPINKNITPQSRNSCESFFHLLFYNYCTVHNSN